ncbi:hypothetical protein AB1Y20_007746 [Prymnesium parvum]|uniref:Diphthamide biosynthesis protein 3 n=1 Tax=Prymnesium parvum TaxID=97485 RepID=A0AB34IRT8_PRYPA
MEVLERDAQDDKEGVYEEVELSEMSFDEAVQTYYYECPCGDMFEITQAQLDAGESIARCPSCSLTIRVLLQHVRHLPASLNASTPPLRITSSSSSDHLPFNAQLLSSPSTQQRADIRL